MGEGRDPHEQRASGCTRATPFAQVAACTMQHVHTCLPTAQANGDAHTHLPLPWPGSEQLMTW